MRGHGGQWWWIVSAWYTLHIYCNECSINVQTSIHRERDFLRTFAFRALWFSICFSNVLGAFWDGAYLAFPSIKHEKRRKQRVVFLMQDQPFELVDPTRPGYRKALILSLVGPTRKIPSATDIPPQQREWMVDVMQAAGPVSLFARLPAEILTMISEEIDETMSRLDAEKYREEMMAERARFDERISKEYFGVVCICIHSVSTA